MKFEWKEPLTRPALQTVVRLDDGRMAVGTIGEIEDGCWLATVNVEPDVAISIGSDFPSQEAAQRACEARIEQLNLLG